MVRKLVICMRTEQTRKHVEDNGNQIAHCRHGKWEGYNKVRGVELILGV